MDGALDLLALERLAADDEMKVDLGEHLRIIGSALRLDLEHAVGYGGACFSQDVNDIVGGAASGADQDGFHRSRAEIAAAAFRRAVHHDGVTAARFADETHVFNPFDSSIHAETPCEIRAADDTRSYRAPRGRRSRFGTCHRRSAETRTSPAGSESCNAWGRESPRSRPVRTRTALAACATHG